MRQSASEPLSALISSLGSTRQDAQPRTDRNEKIEPGERGKSSSDADRVENGSAPAGEQLGAEQRGTRPDQMKPGLDQRIPLGHVPEHRDRALRDQAVCDLQHDEDREDEPAGGHACSAAISDPVDGPF